jgi:intein/homing endonuclease
MSIGKLKKISAPTKLTPDLAWILGVMCGDGSMTKGKSGHEITLSTTNINFGKEFINKINKVFGLNEKFNSKIYINGNNSEFYQVHVWSKELYNYIKSFGEFGCFSWRVPIKIRDANKNCKCSFLRGLYDSDGSFSTYRKKYNRVRLATKNQKGMADVKKLLEDFGIKINLIKEKSAGFSLSVYKKDYIKIFLDDIGFSFK